MKYYESPSFLALQKAWYKRLKDTGFQDIEELNFGEPTLKQSSENKYRGLRGKDPILKAAIEDYFRLLSEHVAEGEFDNDIERIIMQMFASGMKTCVIVRHLAQIKQPRCRTTVFYVVRKYEHRWGMKFYSPAQLNKKRPKHE